MPPARRWHAELILLGITLIWGGTFALVKGALALIPPFLFTALRFLLALLVLLLLWRGSFHRWEPRTVRAGAMLGILLAGGFLLQTLGLLFTTASRSAFITGATVVVVPLLQLLLQRRQVLFWEWLGAVTALFGLWQLSSPHLSGLNIGDALTAVSTLCWAFYIVALDALTRPLLGSLGSSVQLTLLQFAVTAGGAFLAHGLTAPLFSFSAAWWESPIVWLALGYSAILASVVATLAQTHYQRYTTPVRATLIYALEPVFAAAIAAIVLGERLAPHELLGAVVLLCGVALSQLPRMRLSGVFQR